jgi:hypothetical protein
MDHISLLLLSSSSLPFKTQLGRAKIMSASYELVEEDETSYLNIHVKESMKVPIEVTRFLYRGKWERYTKDGKNNATTSLSYVLGTGINQLCHTNKQLKQNLISLQEISNGWQDTASKLTQERQRRQNELIENFLVLLNRTKNDLRATKQELMHFKEQQQQQQQFSNKKNKDTNPCNRALAQTVLPDQILLSNADSIEYLNNTKLINCLAAGISVGNDSNIYNSNSYNHGSSSRSITNTATQLVVQQEKRKKGRSKN